MRQTAESSNNGFLMIRSPATCATQSNQNRPKSDDPDPDPEDFVRVHSERDEGENVDIFNEDRNFSVQHPATSNFGVFNRPTFNDLESPRGHQQNMNTTTQLEAALDTETPQYPPYMQIASKSFEMKKRQSLS